MNPEEKKIMSLATTSHGLVHLYEGVLPPLLPLVMAEFGADYFTMGILVTVFSYAFGLGSLPAGILADKIGPRRLISLYLFGAGTAGILVLPAGSLGFYAIVMGLMGAFCSTYHPAVNTLISLGIKEKGTAFGINGIAGSIGVAVVPVLSAWIGMRLGWRAPHVVFGLIGLGLAFFSLTLPRHPTIQKKSNPQADSRTDPKKKTSVLSLCLFFLSATALGLSYKGIMTFLPTYMGQNIQLGFLKMDVVTMGGTVATLALISGAVGQYVSGRLTDKFPVEKIYFGTVCMGTLFVFVMSFSRGLLLLLASVGYAFFSFAAQPAQNFIVSKYMPQHRQGLGYGTLFILSFGVGSTAAAVSGYLADLYGLQIVFYAMGFCFLAAAGLALGLMLQNGKSLKH
ncbi:MAG: MFS transporter [Desulfobacterales bacterium]|nr:MFS transporter [Desulfobacterales bacterium]MDX2512407.1 MFS transporter [Desulfobacterales bacterium]